MTVLLVTGASSGLGAAIAGEAAQRGCCVYGTSRKPADTGAGFSMVQLDVTDDLSVESAVDAVASAEGRIDVLVNNAGFGLCGAVEDTSLEEARDQFDTNFFGVVRMTRAVLPIMRSQGSGKIITVTSLAGSAGLAYQPYYSATKFALEGFNESLRLELSGSPIQACTVAPGDFRTGFTGARVVARDARSTVHGERLANLLARYEKDERQGADPRETARLVAGLVEEPTLQVRYTVGKRHQRWGLGLKRVVPGKTFERAMLAVYG